MLSHSATRSEPGPRPRRAASIPLLPWAVLALLVATPACAPVGRLAQAPAVPDSAAQAVQTPPASAPTATSSEAAPTESLLRAEVERWRGTPHVYGGESRDGLDCSAFVRNVYDTVFGVSLPRTTSEQAEAGRPVENGLQAGDLVFFRPAAKTRHVGIYLSRGEFAHVSSSDGVTVSRIAEPYWRDAYWTSRRILDEAPRPVAATDATRVEPPSSPPGLALVEPEQPQPRPEQPAPPKRIGW